MAFFLLALLPIAGSVECNFLCPLSDPTDGFCDSMPGWNCVNGPCGFQSSTEAEECMAVCVEGGCDPAHLGNGVCDPDCANNDCFLDGGDCGWCALNCEF